MAKGRKLTTSLSERFLGSFGYNREQETVAGTSEFGEDEVWSTFDNTVNDDNHLVNAWTSVAGSENNGSFQGYMSRRHAPRAASHRHVGGLSSAFEDSNSPRIVHQFRSQDNTVESPRGRHLATSAPVNTPDWSKIYRINSSESLHNSDDGFGHGESELVPPHEYLARSRDMATNSVFQGVGRTLKGRDMSRVRDAVWSQTGFHG